MINVVTIGNRIADQQLTLAELMTGIYYQRHPELDIKYGKGGYEKCLRDSQYHLSYLAEALKAESTEIFSSYLEWAFTMLRSRNIPLKHLLNNLESMEIACQQLFAPRDAEIINGYIKSGIERLKNTIPLPSTYLTDDNPLLPYAKEYLRLLLEANRNKAHTLIGDLVKQNEAIAAIYEHIFQATQYEVGLLWQTNKITVAHEHYCTAATQSIMASLYPYIFDSKKKGTKLLACAIGGDLHEMGIRMLSDLFEIDGWSTYYMGANMPDTNIITAIKEQKADVLAISVTMIFHVSKAEELIKTIRGDNTLVKLKIIVGGYPFRLVSNLWNRIGADGSANNAIDSIALANQLIALN